MPYVIIPKTFGKDLDAALEYAWDEQKALWSEQFNLYYRGVTLSNGMTVTVEDPDCCPKYVDYLDWKLSRFHPTYATRKEAFQSGQFDPIEQVIQFVETSGERSVWRNRECSRLSSGEYQTTPWDHWDAHSEHYAHLSKNDPTKIAYTKDAEHGVQDRQTVVRVGKYLEEFYKGIFSDKQIADYIAHCSAEHYTLQIATSAADIREVYVGGPGSCMGGKAGGAQFADWDVHPVEVYGDSDLAVAFYGKRSAASARAVIWPEKKIYSTIYGDVKTLQNMLKAARYTAGDVDGAKVRAIPYAVNGRIRPNAYYMPYVDGISSASLSHDKQWFWLNNDGEYCTGETDGYSYGRPQTVCDSCGDRYDPTAGGGDGLCDDCYSNQWSCDRCGHRGSSDSDCWMSLNSVTYCENCAYRYYASTCEACDVTWFEETLPRQLRDDRRERGTTAYCIICAQGHRFCTKCDALIPDADTHCDECKSAEEEDATKRCAHTGDLLTADTSAESNGE